MIAYNTIVSPTVAATHVNDPSWLFVDCSFDLADPRAGRRAYDERHIPGSVFADLDEDLSTPVIPGRTGRHPLPSEAAVNGLLSRLGIEPHSQVVAYDEATGGMAAARLWWILQWAGHSRVAVLDGGFDAWRAAGLATTKEPASRAPSNFVGDFRADLVVSADDIARASMGTILLVDSRAEDRYRGENETIDPVPGHIPGASCLPYLENVGPDGRFLSVEDLRRRFEGSARSSADGSPAVFYCGSGVTAAHNVLAYAYAFGAMPRLYPGSWSEWITDPTRPVRLGEEP